MHYGKKSGWEFSARVMGRTAIATQNGAYNFKNEDGGGSNHCSFEVRSSQVTGAIIVSDLQSVLSTD